MKPTQSIHRFFSRVAAWWRAPTRRGLVSIAIAATLLVAGLGTGIAVAAGQATSSQPQSKTSPITDAKPSVLIPDPRPTHSASATPTPTPTAAPAPPPTASPDAAAQAPVTQPGADAPDAGTPPAGGLAVQELVPSCPEGSLSIEITSGSLEQTDTTRKYTIHGAMHNGTNWTAVVDQGPTGVHFETFSTEASPPRSLGMPSAKWDISGDMQQVPPGGSVGWTLDRWVPNYDDFEGPVSFRASGYAPFSNQPFDGARCPDAPLTGWSNTFIVG